MVVFLDGHGYEKLEIETINTPKNRLTFFIRKCVIYEGERPK
jgi:hypothetical protein